MTCLRSGTSFRILTTQKKNGAIWKDYQFLKQNREKKQGHLTNWALPVLREKSI